MLLVFFKNQFPPPAPEYPIRTVSNFSKIRGDIRKSRCTTGINDTGGKFATGVNHTANFATSFAGVVDTEGKFATGVNDTGGNLPPVSTTPVVNNCNNIRLLRPYSELEAKNISISLLYFPKVSKLNN